MTSLMIACSGTAATAADRVILEPVEDPELSVILADSFTLPMLIDLEGQTETDIAAAISAEVRKLRRLLFSLGYLEARIETQGTATNDNPFQIKPVPGRLYRIGWIRIDGVPSPMSQQLTSGLNDFIAQETGKIATQEVLSKIADGVLFELREASYGNATVATPDVKVEKNTRTAGVMLAVEPRASLTLGSVEVEGSFRMSSVEAQALVPFEAGDPYSKTAIDALYEAFAQTNQFRRIRIEMANNPDADGRVDLFVELRDSAPDPNALDESSGIGPTRLILTMLMIVLLESVRVTSFWSHAAVRRALTITVMLMIGVSGLMIFERLYGFLL